MQSHELLRAKKFQIGNVRKDLSESCIMKAYERCENPRRLMSGGALAGPLYEQIKNVSYDQKSA